MSFRFALSFALLAAACNAPDLQTPDLGLLELPDDADPPNDARFVGTWLVEETVAHATYYASQWRFDADGTLTLVHDASMGGGGLATYPTFGWGGGAYIECGFGGTWRSPNDERLVVQGTCTDEINREVVISFEEDASQNAVSTGPTLVSLGGDSQMWTDPVWGWHFVKCEGDFSNCEPWQAQ